MGLGAEVRIAQGGTGRTWLLTAAWRLRVGMKMGRRVRFVMRGKGLGRGRHLASELGGSQMRFANDDICDAV
jgi:hypothetical protein